MRTILLATVMLAAGVSPAAAQSTCRANRLGTVTCPAPPPEPRPILEADTQALDRVRRAAEADAERPALIPSWRVDRLGVTRTGPGEVGGAGAFCRRRLARQPSLPLSLTPAG